MAGGDGTQGTGRRYDLADTFPSTPLPKRGCRRGCPRACSSKDTEPISMRWCSFSSGKHERVATLPAENDGGSSAVRSLRVDPGSKRNKYCQIFGGLRSQERC